MIVGTHEFQWVSLLIFYKAGFNLFEIVFTFKFVLSSNRFQIDGFFLFSGKIYSFFFFRV